MDKKNPSDKIVLKKKITPLREALAGILVLIIAVSGGLLIRDIGSLGSRGLLTPRHHARDILDRTFMEKPAVDGIQDWMTFDYLNRIFHLAPDALKNALAVTDARYPRITIRRYAQDAHLDAAAALTRVKNSVRAQQAAPPHQ
jgi:hypothetical protein